MLDVLDVATELLDLIPEWMTAEREKLTERCNALIDRVNRDLRVKKET